MRNVYKQIAHIEATTWGGREQPTPSNNTARPPRPKVRAWRADDDKPRSASADEQAAHRQFEQTEVKRSISAVTARSVKVTVGLNAAELMMLDAREGGPSRCKFTIDFDHGSLRADVASKSIRKAQGIIREHGVENAFCTLQGKLGKGEILECGLVAQAKATKQGDQQS
jgi:hypothetical protein